MPEPPEPQGRPVLAFCGDLLFVAKIETTARALGRAVRFRRSVSEAGAWVAAEGPALVLVDLALKDGDPGALIHAVRGATTARIVAFGSHVDRERLDGALRAGADEALPRSAFTRRLAELLAAPEDAT